MLLTKTKQKWAALGLGACCALLVLCVPTTMPKDSSSAATFAASSGENFSVSAFSKQGGVIESEGKTVKDEDENSYTYYSSSWKDISYFELDATNAISSLEGNGPFSYNYEVLWVAVNPTLDGEEQKIIINADQNERKQFLANTATSKDNIPSKIRFYVDSKPASDTGEYYYDGASVINVDLYKTHGGWGMYQFTFKCNDVSSPSDLFEVKPLSLSEIPETTALEISKENARSDYYVDSAYLFSIKDSDYLYVNRSFITWYAEGTSTSNDKYVLVPSHKTDKEKTFFSVDDSSIHATTFKFDFDVSGNWKVYCKITDPTNAELTRTSNQVEITTVKTMPTSTIIWIVVGAVLAGAAILTIIIVIAKKKEKIW